MGHGHVIPNADGSRARCGGPLICAVCALEFAQQMLKDTKEEAHGNASEHDADEKADEPLKES